MADITKPENLAFRLGMIGVTSALAQPISPIVGAYIYSKFGYIGVFSATLIGMLCAGILLLIRIRPYKWKREKKEVCFIVTVICPCAELTWVQTQGWSSNFSYFEGNKIWPSPSSWNSCQLSTVADNCHTSLVYIQKFKKSAGSQMIIKNSIFQSAPIFVGWKKLP